MPHPFLAAAFVVAAAASLGGAFADGHARVSLVADENAVPGGELTVAVRIEPEPGWHVYAKDPGEAGLATEVEWSAEGASPAGELEWPEPKTFRDSGVTTYGYDGPALLKQRFRVADDAAGSVTVRADVSWLACREACVPGKASVETKIPVSPSQGGSS